MKKPENVELNEQETEALLARLSSCSLSRSDKKLAAEIIQSYIWLQWALQETKLSLNRLRSLFGFCKKTERRGYLSSASKKDGSAEGSSTEEGLELAKTDGLIQEKPVKGHGRLGHEDYTGATVVEQAHDSLKPGDDCPNECGGRVYSLKPKAMIVLKGHALASATRYLLERLRCSLCGEVFTASLEEGAEVQKYDASLKTHLAIAKNYAGLPFYRTEMLQNMVGVPLPDATQWDLTESLADGVYPVYYEMERLAAQGRIVHHDDTVVRILSLMKENREKQGRERRGMYTTGIVSQVGQYVIYLFVSSKLHSGENMTKLLAKRSPETSPILRMCDALSSNLTVAFKEILCHCLAHGRRKFYEIYDYFPGECRVVIDALALVYHNDAVAKEGKMTDQERLVHHQTHSAPIMKGLYDWINLQIEGDCVEPNSSLGKAFNYMVKHRDKLTRFLEVAGAPLDNNVTERALKIPIRSRKNSLFYKTEHGAFVGGMLTSVIHTCVMAKENPVDYLTALQKNKTALFKSPQDWTPWNYRKTMEEQALSQAA